MTEKLAEPILNAAIALVQANMAAALTKVGNDYTDGIALPVPADANYFFGERTAMGVREFPAVIFDADDTSINEFGNTWATYDWRITIDVLIKSDDEAVLARQVLRYGRALWEILYANQVVANSGGVAQAISLIPRQGLRSPLVPSGRAFLKGWRWLCEVVRYDDLG